MDLGLIDRVKYRIKCGEWDSNPRTSRRLGPKPSAVSPRSNRSIKIDQAGRPPQTSATRSR